MSLNEVVKHYINEEGMSFFLDIYREEQIKNNVDWEKKDCNSLENIIIETKHFLLRQHFKHLLAILVVAIQDQENRSSILVC